MPISTLIKTFIIADQKNPPFNSSKVSKLNVEKVLKPPQNPIIKARYIVRSIDIDFMEKP